MGRPFKAQGEPRSKQIRIRLTARQDARLRELVAKADMSITDWVVASAILGAVVVRNPGSTAELLGNESAEVERVIDQEQLRVPGT